MLVVYSTFLCVCISLIKEVSTKSVQNEVQYYSCSSKSAKTFIECSNLGPSGIDNGCYYNDIFQYKSCYNLCHGKTVDTRDGDKCVYRCESYVKDDCELLTTLSASISSTEANVDESYKYIVPIVIVIVIGIAVSVFSYFAKMRQKKRSCFYCKERLRCCWCQIAQKFCCKRYAIVDVGTENPDTTSDEEDDDLNEGLPLEASS